MKKKNSIFSYKSYSYKLNGDNLEISFLFEAESEIKFKPKIIIENIDKKRFKKIEAKVLDNLIFQLGLIEMLSYWKAGCWSEIIVEAGCFESKKQIIWWHDLILKGMRQFFYENKINFLKKNFLKIKVAEVRPPQKLCQRYEGKLKNRYLVPIGGGKDSIVTLEKLISSQGKNKIGCFLVNPDKAARGIVQSAGIKNLLVVKRKIGPTLLKLNKKGYYNGHIPITAVLSFLSVLAAVLFDYKQIAFSNEKSADQGNIKYLGKIVNHQWSKSSEFEKKFQRYSQRYLAKNIKYFSFLRKYGELEIAKIFINYPEYFSIFSSCNVVKAKKLKKRWCANCSKCLFVYALLYPFLEKDQIFKIFETDIFDNKKLLPTMKDLLGQGRAKPFECVGTYKESKKAFELSLKKAKKSGKLPYLLTKLMVS